MQPESGISYKINPNKTLALRVFFPVFYLVGAVGLMYSRTFELFCRMIPLALLISAVAVIFFHPGRNQRKDLLVFTVIFISGFLAELAGVNTKAVFGNYHYGSSLGPQVFYTPLLIGLNWALLIYLTSSVTALLRLPALLSILVASFLMIIYDFVLEQVAPLLDMWHWADDRIPLQNYFVWFVLSVVFHTLLKFSKIKTPRQPAVLIFICQFLFFMVLFLYFKVLD